MMILNNIILNIILNIVSKHLLYMVSFDPYNNSVMHVVIGPEILEMRKLKMKSLRSISLATQPLMVK